MNIITPLFLLACGLAKISGYDHSSPIGLSITDDNKNVVIGNFAKAQFQGYETLIVRFDENGMLDENFGESECRF